MPASRSPASRSPVSRSSAKGRKGSASSPKWERVKIRASGAVVFIFPKDSEAPAKTLPPEVSTEDVRFFFPLENAPEEMSIAKVLDPAFPWTEAFHEFWDENADAFREFFGGETSVTE